MIIENKNQQPEQDKSFDFQGFENEVEKTDLDYKKRIDDLEKTVKELKELLEGDIKAKTYTAIGGFSPDGRSMVNVPFVISNEQKNLDKKQRQAGLGLAVTSNALTEAIQTTLTGQKYVDVSALPPSLNQIDFNQVQEGQLTMEYQPDINRLFIYSFLTPFVDGTGTIQQGGNTLTDHSAKFKSNQFAPTNYNNGILYILNSQNQYETYKILSNTSNTITIDGTWASESGAYPYYLFFPAYLGSASFPFKRIFAGEDIRLGYGDSAGNQVAYIKFGKGSPEGEVSAQPGSIYLNLNGGENTSFYTKTAGTGNTGWQALADFGTAVLPFTDLYVTGDVRLGTDTSFVYITKGHGNPENIVSAPPGSLYINLDGGVNTTFYVKTSGTGDTNWQALADFGTSVLPFTNLYVTTDIKLGTSSSYAYVKIGSGSPEGVITAPPGSLYLNLNGGTNTTLYVKTSGTGNTGWTAK